MGAPWRVFLGRFGFPLAFPLAVGIAFDQGDVGMMGEAVQQGGDAGGVGEDGVPFLEGLVGGQEDGIAFIAVVDDFEQQVGSVSVVGEVTTFIDDQQVGAGIEAEIAAAAGGGIALEVGEQVAGGAKESGVAGEHGGVGDILGDHRFSEPVGSADDEVAALGQEV